MGVTRMGFIQGALASLGLGALGGRRLFAAPPGWKHGGAPNLVFGVLSDTHLRTARTGDGIGACWPDKYFVAALEYFKNVGADAVVHCGDFAHRGQTREMEFHSEAWRRVFKIGPEPIKLFVTGNHDVEGSDYGDFVKNRYPDEAERARHVLATDMAGNWERIWGEKYEPVWHKEVKGYHFIGQNYDVPDDEAVAFLKKCGGDFALDRGDRPFFFMRHRRPDAKVRKQGLNPLRNAVAFFGHNHWSVTNWNVLSLYYGRLPLIECASCEPRGCRALVGDEWITKAKIEVHENVGGGRQGYVVRLYDDMMVIERREFGEGGSLGADWVMPLGKTPHPFSKEELKKVIGEPQFRKGAKLEVGWMAQGTKATKGTEGTVFDGNVADVASVPEVPSLRLSIPLADGNPDSRVYAYEVVVVCDEGAPKLHKAVYAAGCNLGIGHEPNGGVTTLEIAASELPPGKTLTFAVRPLTSLGTSGKAIATGFKI